MRGDNRRFLTTILSAIGVSSVAPMMACGSTITIEGGGGNGGAPSSSSSSSGSVGSNGSSVSSTSGPVTVGVGVGGAGGAGTCPNVAGVEHTFPPNLNCPPVQPGLQGFYVCYPGPGNVDGCAALYSSQCVVDNFQCGLFFDGEAICGPIIDGGDCCYVLEGGCAVGRPFVIDGQARLAPLTCRRDWLVHVTPPLDDLDLESRRVLAAAWRAEGQSEHASVASFGRFALQLLALGAPPALVRDAQRAVQDELAHARMAYALASHYDPDAASAPIGPAPLAIARALRAVDPIAVADSVCCEGAIAETVAAMLVAAARDRAESPALKRALASVAEEELAHAGLAWRYLAWSVQRHGAAVREVLLRRFAEAERHVGVGPVPLAAPAMREALERHGHLTREERRRIARHVLAEVVAPAASSLLSLA